MKQNALLSCAKCTRKRVIESASEATDWLGVFFPEMTNNDAVGARHRFGAGVAAISPRRKTDRRSFVVANGRVSPSPRLDRVSLLSILNFLSFSVCAFACCVFLQ